MDDESRMSEPVDILAVYLHLASASQRRRRLHVRDRLLVIAASIAAMARLPRIAAYCRRQILEHNPQHLIRRWDTVEQALQEPDFLHLLRSVQRRYPQEKAERLLDTLGIDRARERHAYYSAEEYAASLLGVSIEQLSD
jgi:hypothetical protein